MHTAPTDVLIHGAGPVGAAAALALRDAGLSVALLERDGGTIARALRPIALSYGSRLILERVGAWRRLSAPAIETVRVSQRGPFGSTVLGADDVGVPALGYVVEYDALSSALQEALRDRGIAPQREAPSARC